MHAHPATHERRAMAAAVALAALLAGSTAQAQERPGRLALHIDETPPPIEPWDQPEGSEENPEAPNIGEDGTPVAPTGYPLELIHRPLTLAPGMFEIEARASSFLEPLRAIGQLDAAYGIDSRIQLGVTYGPGAVDEDGFVIGKGVSLEVRYLLEDWLSAQVAVPMLLDPYSMGLTAGVPIKITLFDKLALIAGHDLISVRLVRFVPVPGDALENERLVAQDAVNTQLPRGVMRFLGGVIYQIDPDLAFTGEFGVLAQNFTDRDAGMLRAALTYSPGTTVDVGMRVGFDDLDQPDDTFGATVFFAWRI